MSLRQVRECDFRLGQIRVFLLGYQTFLSKDFGHKLCKMRKKYLVLITTNKYNNHHILLADSIMLLLNFRAYSGVLQYETGYELSMTALRTDCFRLVWSEHNIIALKGGS